MEKKEPGQAPKKHKFKTDKAKNSAKKTKRASKTNSAPRASPRAMRRGGRNEKSRTVMDLPEERGGRSSAAPSESRDVCFPVLINFLNSLSDEQWRTLWHCVSNPESREKFFQVCQSTVKVISETVFRLLVPAIMEVLQQMDQEDPGSVSSSRASRKLDDLNRECTSLKWKGLGTQHLTKPASASSRRDSQASTQAAEIDDPLKTLFGVTEDSILESLPATSTSRSPELTRAMVGEVVAQINSSISVVVSHTCLGRSSPGTGFSQMVTQVTKQMVRVISAGLQRFGMTKKPGSKMETTASEQTPSEALKELDFLLDPVAGEVVTTMADALESCQDVPGSGQGAVEVLREIAHKISILKPQRSDTNGSAKMAAMGSEASINMEVVSSPDFQENASRAVSEVLKRRASSLSVRPSQRAGAAASRTDVLGSVSPTPCLSVAQAESAASLIVQSFVSDLEECIRSERDGAPTRRTLFSEAQRVCLLMQARLKSLFRQPVSPQAKGVSRTAIPEEPQAVEMETLFTSDTHGQSDTTELHPVDGEELEPCTQEVLCMVLAAYKLEDTEAVCSPVASRGVSPEHSHPPLYMDQLIGQLDSLTNSSYGPPGSEYRNPAICSSATVLPSIKKLSSESFLNKARDGVTEVLLRNSERNLSSATTTLFAVTSTSPKHSVSSQADMPPSETQIEDKASEIIQLFVSDVIQSAQAIGAGDMQGQADVDQPLLLETDATISSHNDSPTVCPRRMGAIFSATMKLYQNLQGKLAEVFTQRPVKEKPTSLQEVVPVISVYSGLNERPHSLCEALGQAQSIHADLVETTKEVISEILITYKAQVDKVRACPSTASVSSEESTAAGEFVQDILTQLEGFTTSRSPSPPEDITTTPLGLGKSSPRFSTKMSIGLTLPIDSLTSPEFKRKATNAVSSVLLRMSSELYGLGSEPSSQHVQDNIQTVPEPTLTSRDVRSEATELVDTFVEDMRRLVSETAVDHKAAYFPAALRVVKRLQAKLKDFYGRLLAVRPTRDTSRVPPQGEQLQEQARATSAPAGIRLSLGASKSQPVLTGGRSVEDVALRRGQSESSRPMMALSTPKISQAHLDTTTKEVIREIIVLHREMQVSQEEGLPVVGDGPSFVENIMGCLDNISSARSSTLPLSASPEEIIQQLSCGNFQAKATEQLKGVLLRSIRGLTPASSKSFSQTGSYLLRSSTTTSDSSLDSAVVEIYGAVVDGVKALLHTSESIRATEIPWPADSVPLRQTSESSSCSVSEASVRAESQRGITVSEVSMWSATQQLYQSLQRKLNSFLNTHKETASKNDGAPLAEAKERISEILVCIQEGMSRCEEEEETPGKHWQLRSMVGAMIETLDGITLDDEPQRTTSATSSSSKKKTPEDMFLSLPGTPIPSEVPVVTPVIRSTTIDTAEDRELEVTAKNVVSMILEHVDPAALRQATSPGEDAAAHRRLEQLIPRGVIKNLSRDLVDRLQVLMLLQRDVYLMETVGAGRSVSDTLLSRCRKIRMQTQRRFPSELIYSFAEESVKRLLLPLLLPATTSQNVAQPFQVSSHGFLRPSSSSGSSAESNCSHLYSDTVSLFTRVMVHQVMDTLSQDSETKRELDLATVLDTDTADVVKSPLGVEDTTQKKAKGRFRFWRRFCFSFKRSKTGLTAEHHTKESGSFEERHCVQSKTVQDEKAEERPARRSLLKRMFSAMICHNE